MGFYFDIKLSEHGLIEEYSFNHFSLEYIIVLLLAVHPKGHLALNQQAVLDQMQPYVGQSNFTLQKLSNGIDSRNMELSFEGEWEGSEFIADRVSLNLKSFDANIDSERKILKHIQTLERNDQRLYENSGPLLRPLGAEEDFYSSFSSSEFSGERFEISGDEKESCPSSPVFKHSSHVPPKSLFASLKWPTVVGFASMALSMLLQASRIALLCLSAGATLTFGLVNFALVYVVQRFRDELKKVAFKQVFRSHDNDLDLQTCVDLPEQQWLAVREGMEGQRSMLTQFKSCFNKNNWSHVRYYYSGVQLSELEPDLKCMDVDAIRKLEA